MMLTLYTIGAAFPYIAGMGASAAYIVHRHDEHGLDCQLVDCAPWSGLAIVWPAYWLFMGVWTVLSLLVKVFYSIGERTFDFTAKLLTKQNGPQLPEAKVVSDE